MTWAAGTGMEYFRPDRPQFKTEAVVPIDYSGLQPASLSLLCSWTVPRLSVFLSENSVFLLLSGQNDSLDVAWHGGRNSIPSFTGLLSQAGHEFLLKTVSLCYQKLLAVFSPSVFLSSESSFLGRSDLLPWK